MQVGGWGGGGGGGGGDMYLLAIMPQDLEDPGHAGTHELLAAHASMVIILHLTVHVNHYCIYRPGHVYTCARSFGLCYCNVGM